MAASECVLLPPTDQRWMKFINVHPRSSIFHHPAWIKSLSETYGYASSVPALLNPSGEIVAGLPLMDVSSWLTGRRWISLPFSDHCEPLIADDVFAHELFNYIVHLQGKRSIQSIEIRAPITARHHVQFSDHQVLHQLTLHPDPGKIFNQFHRTSVRQRISQARREGLEIRKAKDQRDLSTFYRLQLKTRRRLGIPVQPKRFFQTLWKRIIKPGLGYILLVYKQDLPIAGGLFLTFRSTVTYKYAASDHHYWRYKPNHFLLWDSIREACLSGYSTFDLGKSDLDDTGLRYFKNGWGTQESKLVYSFLTSSKGSNTKSVLNEQIFQIAKTVIRVLPPLFCRMMGELLYKHFA